MMTASEKSILKMVAMVAIIVVVALFQGLFRGKSLGLEQGRVEGYDKGYTEGYAKGNDDGIHWAGCVSLMHRDKDKNGKLSKNTVDYCKKYGVYDESYKSIMGK